MLALSQAIMSMRNMVNYSYYSKLSEESAEAGTVYAYACFEANGRVQTWGNTSTTKLTQSSNCSGSNQTLYAPSTTGGNNASIPIRFSVGDASTTPYSLGITATGTSTMPGKATPIVGSLNRSVTWKANLVSQSSASGTFRTCGILSGNVYCWGTNNYGQLGNNTTVDSLVPVKVYKETGVLAGKLVTSMFAAQNHNCAIAAGDVYCWGRNNYGQLGNNSTTNSSKPVKVSGPWTAGTVTEIGGTSYVSCAIAAGKIYCWGYNGFGSVGVNTTTTTYKVPTLVATTASGLPSTYTATTLTSGSRSANMCAIANGKAYCWGPNKAGQIGNNTTPDSTIYKAPTAVYTGGVLSGKTVIAIAQDGYSEVTDTPAPPTPPPHAHVCAVATDSSGANGRVYCWGENNAGQLGNNSTTDVKAPTAVTTSGVLSGKTMVDVVAGIQHTCALTSEGKVSCWGENGSGQIGDGTNTDRKVPTAVYEQAGILLNAQATSIGGGANRGCAIVNQRSYCWGLNSNGQIGDNTTTDRNKPTESIFLRPQNNNFIY